MPYTADRTIASLYDPRPLERRVRRMGERTVSALRDAAARRTPVAKAPAAAPMGPSPRAARRGAGTWIEARGGRVPGTMKESWRAGDVSSRVSSSGADGVEGEAYTEDPAAPYVEEDTVPHLIRPRLAKALRFWDDVSIHFRKVVHHPGTTGQHMMRDALAEVEAEQMPAVMGEELDAWAREVS